MEAASTVKSSFFFFDFLFVVFFSVLFTLLFVCSFRVKVLEADGEPESSDTTRSTSAGESLPLGCGEAEVDGGAGGVDGLCWIVL